MEPTFLLATEKKLVSTSNSSCSSTGNWTESVVYAAFRSYEKNILLQLLASVHVISSVVWLQRCSCEEMWSWLTLCIHIITPYPFNYIERRTLSDVFSSTSVLLSAKSDLSELIAAGMLTWTLLSTSLSFVITITPIGLECGISLQPEVNHPIKCLGWGRQ